MSLITDKVFYNALKSSSELLEAVGNRIENTSIPVPDEELPNEPVPYIIITFDGLQNEGLTKDNSYEGDTDRVTVSIEVAAPDRETLGNITDLIRQTVIAYFEDTTSHAVDDYDLVPESYEFSAGPIQYDSMKPCFFQTLSYGCVTNP